MCGKVEEGDEVVQVNYQTVVSFPFCFVSVLMHLSVYFYSHFFEEYTMNTSNQGDSNSHDHNWYMFVMCKVLKRAIENDSFPELSNTQKPVVVNDLRPQNLNFVAPIPEHIGTTTMHSLWCQETHIQSGQNESWAN